MCLRTYGTPYSKNCYFFFACFEVKEKTNKLQLCYLRTFCLLVIRQNQNFKGFNFVKSFSKTFLRLLRSPTDTRFCMRNPPNYAICIFSAPEIKKFKDCCITCVTSKVNVTKFTFCFLIVHHEATFILFVTPYAERKNLCALCCVVHFLHNGHVQRYFPIPRRRDLHLTFYAQ